MKRDVEKLSMLGAVVIGRNEGERLQRSLASILRDVPRAVYADSSSSDGSVERARSLGADVVVLDSSARFTAARGRNAGLALLRRHHPGVEYVQFVDGDTEIASGWLAAGAKALGDDPKLGVVCGRLFEKDRQSNVFRRVFGLEWDGPIGEVRSCGGIAMMRIAAVEKAGGYDDSLVAGEEAELCAKIRREGFVVRRIDMPMGEHDSGIDSLSPWWTRTVRVGHAYAKACFQRDGDGDPGKFKQVVSAVVWGGVMPIMGLTILGLSLRWPMLALFTVVIAGAYALLALKIFVRSVRMGRSQSDAWWYAVFCLIAKVPQFQGFLKYMVGG